jgi:hypothetical protein
MIARATTATRALCWGAGTACRWPFLVGCAIDQFNASVSIRRIFDVGEKAMPTSPASPFEVFISYSHKDEALREKLGTHLSLLRRQGVIDAWHDRRIGAGQEWAGAIDEHLNSAAVIILLISPDFLASDYCYDLEMTRALQRHDAGDARVIPVILRRADLEGAPFAKLQALPKDAKPVKSWTDEDEAFADVARGIREAVEGLRARP